MGGRNPLVRVPMDQSNEPHTICILVQSPSNIGIKHSVDTFHSQFTPLVPPGKVWTDFQQLNSRAFAALTTSPQAPRAEHT
jgi:hypothetical protein